MRIRSSAVAALIAMAGAVPAPARAAAAPVTDSPRLSCVDAHGAAHESPLPRPGERCAPVGVPVPPGWTWVAGAPGLNIYTHSALGAPPPGLVKLWVLYSFATPKGGPGKEHLSAKQLEFHSCAVGTSIHYAQPLGEGEVVQSTQADQLKQLEIPPDTASSWVWKSVCAR
jgi:hypothetical protein